MTCRLRSLWGTLTMAAFWRSLAHPPLVVFDGHRYDMKWDGHPTPDEEFGQIEFAEGLCAVCHGRIRLDWRRWWGAA